MGWAVMATFSRLAVWIKVVLIKLFLMKPSVNFSHYLVAAMQIVCSGIALVDYLPMELKNEQKIYIYDSLVWTFSLHYLF